MSEQPTNRVQVELPAEFHAALEELRTIRLAQLASVDQQREMARYFTELNAWLEEQVLQRQDDIQTLKDQVDEITEQLVRGDLEGLSLALFFRKFWWPPVKEASWNSPGGPGSNDRDQHTYYSDRQPHNSVSENNAG
ncbi:hypothetical protein EDD85DRAFT_791732 [Armillaria nabsnona]|nr:hypothetical protein EDD85DRAFT_791732 [Armillaria nabsnona]